MRVNKKDGLTRVTLVDKTITFEGEDMIPQSLKNEIMKKLRRKVLQFVGTDEIMKDKFKFKKGSKYGEDKYTDRMPTERVFSGKPNCLIKRQGKFVDARVVVNGYKMMVEPMEKDSACYLINMFDIPDLMWESNRIDIQSVPHKRLYHRGKSLQKIKNFYKGGMV